MLTIDDLPDDVLLEIFDFYVVRYQDWDLRQRSDYVIKKLINIESWQSLVHVCRRWRGLVFGSPRRLNLQLCCTPSISSRKTLDVWPALPLVIQDTVSEGSVDDVVAVFEHSDRISLVDLVFLTTSQVEKLWEAMQGPFPELGVLRLSVIGLSYGPVLPDSLLRGSAPRLQYLALTSIPFPALPNLLLSATDLVHLRLQNIPHSGYISPEAMVTCLSMLTSLESLQLEFKSPQSYPDLKSRRPFSPTRSVLPALTIFSFKGVNEYLEEFVARIDAPQLHRLSTTFFNDIDLNTPELNQFLSRTPTLGAYDEADFVFSSGGVHVKLRQSHLWPSDHRMVEVNILGNASNRQLSSLVKICTLSLRLLLTVENLYIDGSEFSPFFWRDDIENTEWLDLLLPFTAVKNLYLSKPFSPRISRALQELTGRRITEVLPALQNVLLEGFQPSEPVHEGIAQFISARQLTNHHVAISVWDSDLVEDKSSVVDDG